jgi:hypothetical protein
LCRWCSCYIGHLIKSVISHNAVLLFKCMSVFPHPWTLTLIYMLEKSSLLLIEHRNKPHARLQWRHCSVLLLACCVTPLHFHVVSDNQPKTLVTSVGRRQHRCEQNDQTTGIQGWKVRSRKERTYSNAGRASCGFIQYGVCESDTAVDCHDSEGLWDSRTARSKELEAYWIWRVPANLSSCRLISKNIKLQHSQP